MIEQALQRAIQQLFQHRRIYGPEDTREPHAFVMELVEGPTLADRLAHGPLPLDEALAGHRGHDVLSRRDEFVTDCSKIGRIAAERPSPIDRRRQ